MSGNWRNWGAMVFVVSMGAPDARAAEALMEEIKDHEEEFPMGGQTLANFQVSHFSPVFGLSVRVQH